MNFIITAVVYSVILSFDYSLSGQSIFSETSFLLIHFFHLGFNSEVCVTRTVSFHLRIWLIFCDIIVKEMRVISSVVSESYGWAALSDQPDLLSYLGQFLWKGGARVAWVILCQYEWIIYSSVRVCAVYWSEVLRRVGRRGLCIR